MEKFLEKYYASFSKKDLESIKEHLKKRYKEKNGKKKFCIVFDISKYCDLCCIGCGTNAIYTPFNFTAKKELPFEEIVKILKKIKDYSKQLKTPIKLVFGGGEPFMRKDILDILKTAAKLFSAKNIGIDTNATLPNSYKLIKSALPYIGYIGISINGLKGYHNWWANNKNINAFERSMWVIKRLCKNKETAAKLEVTSVATTKNIKSIPKLIKKLSLLGVKQYSVHRAIPVGRMAYQTKIIPDSLSYLKLLNKMIKAGKKYDIDLHLHHSIESIHSTLLLGLDTYSKGKVGNPDSNSSIGIDPEGNLVFDPWCTTGIWKHLTFGNLLKSRKSIKTLLHNEPNLLKDIIKSTDFIKLRCNGCTRACSGGSRIVAAATLLNQLNKDTVSVKLIKKLLSAVDPACPLCKIK